jgi:hypothetical protein
MLDKESNILKAFKLFQLAASLGTFHHNPPWR